MKKTTLSATAVLFVYRGLLFPVVERDGAFYVGMEAVFYRTGGGGALDDKACFGVVLVRDVDLYDYLADAARL